MLLLYHVTYSLVSCDCPQVYTIETQPMMARMIEKYIARNKLKSRVKVLDKSPDNITEKDLDGRKVQVVLHMK